MRFKRVRDLHIPPTCILLCQYFSLLMHPTPPNLTIPITQQLLLLLPTAHSLYHIPYLHILYVGGSSKSHSLYKCRYTDLLPANMLVDLYYFGLSSDHYVFRFYIWITWSSQVSCFQNSGVRWVPVTRAHSFSVYILYTKARQLNISTQRPHLTCFTLERVKCSRDGSL